MNEERLGQLIEGAYDAAVDGSWHEWLDSFRRALASEGAILALLSQNADALPMMPIASGQQHYDHQELTFYLQHKHRDPFFLEMAQRPNSLVVLDDNLRALRLESELGDFFAQRQDRASHSVASITGGPDSKVVVGLFRGEQQPAFEPKHLRDIEQILQHLSRAMAQVPFIEERVEQRLQKAELAQHKGPQAVVRNNGTPVYINSAMEHYLANNDNPIEVSCGRLVADRPLMQRLLVRAQQRAIAQACAVKLPLAIEEQVTIQPLPDEIYPGATLWRIGA